MCYELEVQIGYRITANIILVRLKLNYYIQTTYPNTVALLNLIGKRLISYDLTFDHLYNSCSLIVEKLYEKDFSEAELQKAKKMIDDAEQRFHERRGGFISKPRRKKNS